MVGRGSNGGQGQVVMGKGGTNLHTKFQPNQTIFVEVIHLNRFSAGRLVGPVHIIRFQKNFSLKSEWMQ